MLTGQILLEAGVITKQQLEACLSAQQLTRQTGKYLRIGEIIVRNGYASRNKVEDAIRKTGNAASGFTSIELPFTLCRSLLLMPLGIENGVLYVASRTVLTETDKMEIIQAARKSGNTVDSVEEEPRDAAEVMQYVNSLQGVDQVTLQGELEQFWQLIKTGNDRSSGGLLQSIINHVFIDSLQQSASDVHLVLSKSDLFCKIKYRIDGVLFDKYNIPTECMRRLVTQVKKRSVPDASERLRPQDGRMSLDCHGRSIDLRVATSSDDDGETIVIRLLDPSKTASLNEMLIEQPELLAHFKSLANVRGKHGELVIVTGPTGQGKSTTLSGLMYAMPRERIRIDTAEDPVETRVPGVHHHQVNELIGLTYSKVLRSALRQDPDVLSVGEIRDPETAEICVRATETGHRVLTTLHTTSVPETITRLISILPDSYRNMGTFAIAKTVRAILNQRLVRRACECSTRSTVSELKKASPIASYIAAILNLPDEAEIAVPVGCELCSRTGHKGRVMAPEAVFFQNDEALRLQMQRLIFESDGVNKMMSLPGAKYFSRQDAVRNLLLQGVIGIESAVDALNIGALEAMGT